ncbi:MAG TPA: hypothetical protein QF802_05900 [Candidatus Thalassarchaeaceae archaeon]|nr:hypothetical protein [Candidatus Thalassarchaeaceae archaeon]
MPLDKAMMMEDEVLTPKGRRMLEMNAKNLELNTWKPGTMILKVIRGRGIIIFKIQMHLIIIRTSANHTFSE